MWKYNSCGAEGWWCYLTPKSTLWLQKFDQLHQHILRLRQCLIRSELWQPQLTLCLGAAWPAEKLLFTITGGQYWLISNLRASQRTHTRVVERESFSSRAEHVPHYQARPWFPQNLQQNFIVTSSHPNQTEASTHVVTLSFMYDSQKIKHYCFTLPSHTLLNRQNTQLDLSIRCFWLVSVVCGDLCNMCSQVGQRTGHVHDTPIRWHSDRISSRNWVRNSFIVALFTTSRFDYFL